mgnify:CR=1 FL=1
MILTALACNWIRSSTLGLPSQNSTTTPSANCVFLPRGPMVLSIELYYRDYAHKTKCTPLIFFFAVPRPFWGPDHGIGTLDVFPRQPKHEGIVSEWYCFSYVWRPRWGDICKIVFFYCPMIVVINVPKHCDKMYVLYFLITVQKNCCVENLERISHLA